MTTTETVPTIEKPKLLEHKSFPEKTESVVEALRRSQLLFDLKKSGKSTKEAVEIGALSLSESDDLGFSESEKNLLGVISHLGSFVTAQRRADELSDVAKDSRLSSDQRDELKVLKNNDIIPFNHTLKELINTNSSLTKDELDVGLTRLYMKLFYRDDPIVVRADTDGTHDQELIHAISQDAFSGISKTTNGMRHEIASEAMLLAANIDYNHQLSVEQDANGADYLVYVDYRWTYIDIKASQTRAVRALSKRPDSHAVWTGLKPADFTGLYGNQVNGLCIPFDKAKELSGAFVQQIYDVTRR